MNSFQVVILIAQFVWANAATATFSSRAMGEANREALFGQSQADVSHPEKSRLRTRKQRKDAAKSGDRVAPAFKSINGGSFKLGLVVLENGESPVSVAEAVFNVQPVVDVAINSRILKMAVDRLFDFFEPRYVSKDAWVDPALTKYKKNLMKNLKMRFPALIRVGRELASTIVSHYLKKDVGITDAALRIVDQATAEVYMRYVAFDEEHTRVHKRRLTKLERLDKIVVTITPQLEKIMTAISLLAVADLHDRIKDGTADFLIGVICKSAGCTASMGVEELLFLSKKKLAEAAMVRFDYENAVYPNINDFWEY